MKSNAIVTIGSTVGIGLGQLSALAARELYLKCSSVGDYYFASLTKESDKGALANLKTWVPNANLILADTFQGVFGKVEELFRSYKLVLIHAGGGFTQMRLLMPLRKRYGRRLIVAVTTHSYRHDSWKRIPMSSFQCLLYRLYVDMVVFQCTYAARRFVGGGWFLRHGKGCVIPLGVEPFNDSATTTPEYKYDGSLMRALEDSSLFKFVYLASFRPGKKHAWLLENLAGILRRHADVRIIFCGGGDDAVKKDVAAMMQNHGLDGQVLMPGRIERVDVPWLLSRCDCAVVPSQAETFGHTFIEPMAAGIPVLGTRVGVGEYMVRDYETGMGFDFSRKSLEYAAEYLVSHRDECRIFGDNARKFVQAMFLKSHIADTYARLYKDLFGRSEKERS